MISESFRKAAATIGSISLWLTLASMATADSRSPYELCIANAIDRADAAAVVGDLRLQCMEEIGVEPALTDSQSAPTAGARAEDQLLYDRLRRERAAEGLPSILTPHNRNYILPATYMDDPNIAPYATAFGDLLGDQDIQNQEVKFQISLKFRLVDSLVLNNDGLFFAFTARSFWQAYNWDASAPFRETNYEPEVFWATALPWRPFNVDGSLIAVGFNHQSNGGAGPLSRSWNRLYANLVWEQGSYVFSLKPWWRIPEKEKNDPMSASGDDNPDIERYMGDFEFATAYRRGAHEYTIMLRNNFGSDGKSAVQLEWAFPLWGRVRGYAQYFNGYGESLIDYDAHLQRVGVGILISDLL